MKNFVFDNEIKNFLDNIAYLRKQNKLSKRKMAEMLGIGVKSLNRIESGELPPNMGVNIVFKIEKNFGVSPKNLFLKSPER